MHTTCEDTVRAVNRARIDAVHKARPGVALGGDRRKGSSNGNPIDDQDKPFEN
jgi:hypothetical protein